MLNGSFFLPGATWIVFSSDFHCFQHPPAHSDEWEAWCDAGASKTKKDFFVLFFFLRWQGMFRLTFSVCFLHLWLQIHICYLASPPFRCINLSNQESSGVCCQSSIIWNKKSSKTPLTCVTFHWEEAKNKIKKWCNYEKPECKHAKVGTEKLHFYLLFIMFERKASFIKFIMYSGHYRGQSCFPVRVCVWVGGLAYIQKYMLYWAKTATKKNFCS